MKREHIKSGFACFLVCVCVCVVVVLLLLFVVCLFSFVGGWRAFLSTELISLCSPYYTDSVLLSQHCSVPLLITELLNKAH